MYIRTRRGALPVFALLLLALAPATGLRAHNPTPDLLESFGYRSIGPTRQSGRSVDLAVPRPSLA